MAWHLHYRDYFLAVYRSLLEREGLPNTELGSCRQFAFAEVFFFFFTNFGSKATAVLPRIARKPH